MKDEQIRELFGEMREEPVPAESLARVRRLVGERARTRRRVFAVGWGWPGWTWKAAAALAAAGCVALMLRLANEPAPVLPGAPAPVAQSPAALEPTVKAEPEPVLPITQKRIRKAARPVVEVDQQQPVEQAQPAEQVPAAGAEGAHEIRIENSEDPDVVIVLIGG